ncbi:DUF1064 domain-containing protein [Paraburkholderia sp. J8-2]|uniref:DUF1064 domain-containing protein n=1 Tax=Paraburkholderia sp. J8-2 TaxID=2805440 RepID=UPI002AB797A4|nr:DUF1064 domain-containing protein [Paraburkholderia sp. J8-2]
MADAPPRRGDATAPEGGAHAQAPAYGPFMGKKAGASSKPKTPKYRNRKCQADGKHFDSEKERTRYFELMARLRRGEIADLRLQVRYVLIDRGLRDDGTTERASHYVADFVYFDKQRKRLTVEDVKSEITKKNPTYVLKRKLMLSRYGISVTEI